MDGISLHLIKYIDTAIVLPLLHIFNLSFSTGTFPDSFKTSRGIPIFKTGDPTSTDNCRPISFINTFGKILEKIVSLKLIKHLNDNQLIYQYQFGFQKGLSTEHNLIHLSNFIGEALNENKYCVGNFLDIKKAFDVVPLNLLLQKLNKMGVRNRALDWFRSYLSDRSQCVEINGSKSTPRSIKLSVMQGSVLGPLLFLCFINDLENVLDLFKLLFAVDTCALHADKDFNNLITHAIETYKYLGVLLDENFNLNKHTDYVCNKLSRALFCINRVKSLLQKILICCIV
jgi:hypothetical protein